MQRLLSCSELCFFNVIHPLSQDPWEGGKEKPKAGTS